MALSVGADDEHLAGGVDDIGVERVELVDLHDAGDLGHEAFDESEVAAGDPDYGANGVGVVGVVGVLMVPDNVANQCHRAWQTTRQCLQRADNSDDVARRE